MKLAWATDLHLNSVSDEEVRTFRREVARQAPKALLLAGNTAEAGSLEKNLLLLGGTLGLPIYFVLGNHDFYGGRVSAVREQMRQLTRKDPARWSWLPAAGVIPLSETAALIGIDGWGDGRIGNYSTSAVELSDWKQIEDLKFLDRKTRLTRLRALGDESGEQLRKLLTDAMAKYAHVVVLTHVPPFKESCWNGGAVADDEWLPWYTCRATGDLLLNAAERNPDKKITVYCGNARGGGTAQVRANLIVHTGNALSGKPATQPFIEL